MFLKLLTIQRTVDIYPAKAYADTHIAHCTVSTTIAEALLSSPEVVSMAVNAFCLPPASGTNKNYIAAMQRFGKEFFITVFIFICEFVTACMSIYADVLICNRSINK